MSDHSRKILSRILVILSALLIIKVTVGIVLGYHNYFPPDFNSDFLRGREDYFYGAYSGAFYVHIVSSPWTLLLGLLLLSNRFRGKFPQWHRRAGRVQGIILLLFVVPSGLWMSRYAAAGPVGAVSLGTLAVLTAISTGYGWRAAIQRKFLLHRKWMMRSFLLLCSAVVLRLFGGLGSLLGVQSPWYDTVATWLSWLAPLMIFEVAQAKKQKGKRFRSARPASPRTAIHGS